MDDSNKLHEAETEIRQLKQAVAALRDELEVAVFEKQTVAQKAAAGSQDEIAQLKSAAQALRDELEATLMDKQASVQQARAESADEISQLQTAAQSLRDSMDEVRFVVTRVISHTDW